MSKLLDQVRDVLRTRHYSYQTEQTYLKWIRRYIFFHNVRHPAEMGKAEVEAFLSHLAVESNVSASTQNQALFALLFLYTIPLPISTLAKKRRNRICILYVFKIATTKCGGTICPEKVWRRYCL
jgi:hypothetical protein